MKLCVNVGANNLEILMYYVNQENNWENWCKIANIDLGSLEEILGEMQCTNIFSVRLFLAKGGLFKAMCIF